MAEFHSDEHRESYLEALEHEITGYEARIQHAVDEELPLLVKRYTRRIDQVKAEIARVNGEPAPSEAKAAAKGRSKAKAPAQ